MLFKLAGDKEFLGDLYLLVVSVAAEIDYLHAVAQADGNAPQRVGGSDEHHLGDVVGHVQEMVGELVVLLRVQHLEQGRRGVAAPVRAHLVDLVHKEDRVAALGFLHALQYAPGHGGHVGAPVPADLGFVAHAAQRHPHEIAAHRVRYGAGDGGLAYAGRADEAEYGAFQLLGKLADGQVFQHALLRLLEAEVLLVQDLLGGCQVYLVLGLGRPGQGGQPVQIGAADGRFGGERHHLGEARQFLLGGGLGFLGHLRRLDALLHLVDLFREIVLLVQLLLYRLHLLVKVILFLGLLDLRLDAAVDLLLDVEYLDFLGQEFYQLLQALPGVLGLQDVLAVGQAEHGIRRDSVGQLRRVVQLLEEGRGVERYPGAELHIGLEDLPGVAHEGDKLRALLYRFLRVLHQGLEESLALAESELEHARAAPALEENPHGPVGHLEGLGNSAYHAVGIKVFGGGVVNVRLFLGQRQDELAGREAGFYGRHGLGAVDGEGERHVGEHHDVPDRYSGQGRWVSLFGS